MNSDMLATRVAQAFFCGRCYNGFGSCFSVRDAGRIAGNAGAIHQPGGSSLGGCRRHGASVTT